MLFISFHLTRALKALISGKNYLNYVNYELKSEIKNFKLYILFCYHIFDRLFLLCMLDKIFSINLKFESKLLNLSILHP